MAYVCFECNTVFDDWIFHAITEQYADNILCPIKSCFGDNVIEVDDIFVDLFIILNDKGYYIDIGNTGHPYELKATFILFANGIKLPNFPKGFEHSYDEADYGFCRIKKEYDLNLSNVEIQKEIFKSVADLLDWAVALPNNNT